MATVITWTITALDVRPQEAQYTDVVVTAHWTCAGVDGEYATSVYSTCSFPMPGPNDPGFTPYADLTQDQVLGWCWANGVDKTATEAAVEQQIQNLINPPIITPPLPWAAPQA